MRRLLFLQYHLLKQRPRTSDNLMTRARFHLLMTSFARDKF